MSTLVVRGRPETIQDDRAIGRLLLDRTAETGEPSVRVWRPHRQLAVGPRDTRAEGFDRAASIASELGYPVVERSVGGRAVAYTGRTLAFARTIPIDDVRSGMTARYEAATELLLSALRSTGAAVTEGEPPGSYCPGTHSVQISSGDIEGDRREPADTYGKVAGLAQRVTGDAAIVSGILTVARADEPELASVLEPVYEALDVPFDPASIGSVAAAGGPDDPSDVSQAIETALVAGSEEEGSGHGRSTDVEPTIVGARALLADR